MKLLANAWAVAVGMVCFAAYADASPSPLRDFIDTCTHPASARSEITDELMSRGWQPLDKNYPAWVPNLLADGHLLWYLDLEPGNERLNFLSVNTETAELPDMAEQMDEMIAAAAQGKSGILVSTGPSDAVVFVHWSASDSPHPGTICYLYGHDLAELDPLFDAFDQTVHNHFVRETGPTKTYSAIFSGKPVAEEPTGVYKLAVGLGILPPRPIFDPPIGAGPSSISVQVYDTNQFINLYDRAPNASYFIDAHTEPSHEVPQ